MPVNKLSSKKTPCKRVVSKSSKTKKPVKKASKPASKKRVASRKPSSKKTTKKSSKKSTSSKKSSPKKMCKRVSGAKKSTKIDNALDVLCKSSVNDYISSPKISSYEQSYGMYSPSNSYMSMSGYRAPNNSFAGYDQGLEEGVNYYFNNPMPGKRSFSFAGQQQEEQPVSIANAFAKLFG